MSQVLPIYRRHSLACALSLVAAVAAPIARADHAVLVGVNEYPQLAPGANLEGCVNDAHSVEKQLVKLGFKTVVLENEKATREAILAALAEARTSNRPDERFVFYFAGHGAVESNGASCLLPADSSEKNEAHDLGRDALYEAVLAVPSYSRTVLLDSCFSGGLGRKGIGRHVKRTRSYRRANQPGLRGIDDPIAKDSNDHIATGPKICYFTASLANQTSGEDDFDGVRGGVFTHFLAGRLDKATTSTLWREVQKDVTGAVADYMDQAQTPKLSPSEAGDLRVFENGEKPKPEPKPDPKPEPKPDPKPEPKPDPKPEPKPQPKRTLWDDFNEDSSSPDQLELEMRPNRSTLRRGEAFTFQARIGSAEGWLVLLDKDTDGKVYLISPHGNDIDAGKVGANTIVRLPSVAGKSYAADAAGSERVKAILFTSRERAEALIKAFPPDGAEPRKLRRIIEVDSPARQPFYTYSLTFGVE